MEEKSVNEESAATAADGKNYRTRFYSLEAIIAVGYRVQSPRATQFRTWATDRLKDYILKGFALDGEQNVARSSRSNAVHAGSQKSIGTIEPHWNDA